MRDLFENTQVTTKAKSQYSHLRECAERIDKIERSQDHDDSIKILINDSDNSSFE